MREQIYRNKIHFFYGLWFLLFTASMELLAGTSADTKQEKAFYAISSLYFHVQELAPGLDQSPPILFEEAEIARLWEQAASDQDFFSEVDLAQQYYYEAKNIHDSASSASLYLKAAELLGILWEKLHSRLLEDATKLNLMQHACAYVSPHKLTYTNFDGNPYLTNSMRKKIKPYLLPINSFEKTLLDSWCKKNRLIETEDSFLAAGFEILFRQPFSFVRIARHPSFKGYIFKVYLDSELRKKDNRAGWEWLVARCVGADNVRNLIKQKNLRFFSVSDKWIYPLPAHPAPKEEYKKNRQPILLLATDMDLVPHEESIDAWKNKITKEHLKELYCILSHGFASSHLIWNIPYSKSGKFACIDTENPLKKPEYKEVKNYLSKEMNAYWDELVKTGGASLNSH